MSDYRNRIFFKGCESMAEIPDGVVQTCVTSPPYWGLRSYCQSDGMIGLEETPQEWCDRLVAVFREVRRVLRDDGTLWLNVGDAYGTGYGRNDTDEANLARRGAKFATGAGAGTYKQGFTPIKHPYKPKDLLGLPWMLAFALRADGWWLRSDIIWSKPNCMPSSVTDRCTSSHEYIFLPAKSRRYFFDADAIREPLAESSIARVMGATFDTQTGGEKDYETTGVSNHRSSRRALENLRKAIVFGCNKGSDGDNATYSGKPCNAPGRNSRLFVDRDPQHDRESEIERKEARRDDEPAAAFVGANKRDVWTIATSGYPGAHFATFPEELARECILAGSSAAGECAKCGAPQRRIIETESNWQERKAKRLERGQPLQDGLGGWNERGVGEGSTRKDGGWEPSCKCGAGIRPQLVLDPFMGSGTTASVAVASGRDFVGYEIAKEYEPLIAERLGMFYRAESA